MPNKTPSVRSLQYIWYTIQISILPLQFYAISIKKLTEIAMVYNFRLFFLLPFFQFFALRFSDENYNNNADIDQHARTLAPTKKK